MKKRLILALATAIVFSLLALGIPFYNKAQESLREAETAKLTAIREQKSEQIRAYIETIVGQVTTMSADPAIIDAMKAFPPAFKNVVNEVDASRADGRAERLSGYYTGEFQSRLVKKRGDKGALSDFLPTDAVTRTLQDLYISSNTNETGSKHLLDAADDGSTYSAVHKKHHPAIRQFLEEFGYYDIFLADLETGHIVYSVFKEIDYATSLVDGPYAKTNFGRAFREARALEKPGDYVLVDFEPYTPSYDAQASFIASPIFDGDTKVGVLLFQMPVDRIGGVMSSGEKWTETGLGATGETLLVGPDATLRSEPRAFLEDAKGFLAGLSSEGTDAALVESLTRHESTMGRLTLKTPAVEAALGGETSVATNTDYRGQEVLVAYAPLELAGLKWALVAKIDTEEAFAPVASLRSQALWIAGIVLALGICAAFFLGSFFSKPIVRVTSKLQALAAGRFSRESIPVRGRDETAMLSEAYNQLVTGMSTLAEGAQQLAKGASATHSGSDEASIATTGPLAEAFGEMERAQTQLAEQAQAIAKGDLNIEVVPRSPEDGLSHSFVAMVDYLKQTAAAADAISHGDLSVDVTPKSDEDVLSQAFVRMTDYVRGISNAAESISRGDLSVDVTPRSDADLLSRSFVEMTSYIREVSTAAQSISRGDLNVTVNPRGDEDVLSHSFVQMTDYLVGVASAASAIARGDFSVTVEAQSEDDSLSHAFISMTGYLQEMYEAADRMSFGDLSVSVTPQSEADALAHAFVRMTDYIRSIAQAAGTIAKGDLSVQVAPRSDHDVLSQSFVAMVEYIKEVAEAAGSIAKGDLAVSVNPRSDQDVLSHSFLQMTDYLIGVSSAATVISQGDLDVAVTPQSENDSLSNAFVSMIAYLKEAASIAENISDGDLTVHVNPRSEQDVLSNAFVSMVRYLQEAADHAQSIARGDLSITVVPRSGQDTLSSSFIGMVDYLKGIENAAGAIGRGDLSVNLTPRSDADRLSRGMNGAIKALDETISQVRVLIDACNEGDLSVRGEPSRFEGAFSDLVGLVNQMLDTVVRPIDELKERLSQVADGDLTAYVSGVYRGDFSNLKTSLNEALDSLNDVLGEVQEVATGVGMASSQIAAASRSQADAATEQAASVQEISQSSVELAAQNRTNAESARQANDSGDQARNLAEQGGYQMESVLSAMGEIETASSDVAGIIRTIDEIAFQTNLLALNASVEAARAGEHGKGFAVVAEEVGSLASRSADAARESAAMVQAITQRVDAGSTAAQQMASLLEQIIKSVEEVTSLVEDIARASVEQTDAIERISESLTQVDAVTQQSAAAAEEGSASAVEMEHNADSLRQLLARFTTSTARRSTAGSVAAPSAGGHATADTMSAVMDALNSGQLAGLLAGIA